MYDVKCIQLLPFIAHFLLSPLTCLLGNALGMNSQLAAALPLNAVELAFQPLIVFDLEQEHLDQSSLES